MTPRLCAHCGKPLSDLRKPYAIYCRRGCNSNARYRRLFAKALEADIPADEIDRLFEEAREAKRKQRWSAA